MTKKNEAPNKSKNKKSIVTKKRPFNWFILVVLVFVLYALFQNMPNNTITWSNFLSYLGNDMVASITVDDTKIVGKFNEQGLKSRTAEAAEDFSVEYKQGVVGDGWIDKYVDPTKVEVIMAKQHLLLMMFMQWVFPLLLVVAFFYFVFARNMKGGPGGMMMSFGRSRHKVQQKGNVNVTFADVAGIEEAKDEVAEIIEFLKNPKRFRKLGGRIPKGVLLSGPPGCGKTLLAKAIAGQADVPFFSISGSDFVEMFVGVGASRVRDLFKQAKTNSPCIIFLDEIDAIGRKRGASFGGGGHDEREQTLNAILVEMDGFDTDDQVIVIAATNRGDVLDRALVRPGRFDRQITVPLPDLKGRLEILQVHAKKVKMAKNADLERLARGTPMFSGADLEAIINEAALAATMQNKEQVETEDLEEARDKVRWGRARKSRAIDAKEKEIVAYHEAGHAVIQAVLEDSDPLHKVSIIPRGDMGGATFALPEKDRTLLGKKYCMALMQVCFGGRIAEEVFCDDISSGAQADIIQATKIAKQMVLVWGMSEKLGPVNYGVESTINQAVMMMPSEKEYSEKTAEIIDNEIKMFVDQAYANANKVVTDCKDKVEAVAKALLKYETLDADDVQLILDGGQLDKPTVADLLAAEQKKNDEDK